MAKPWTLKEIALASKLVLEQRCSCGYAATLLDRSPAAVYAKLYTQGARVTTGTMPIGATVDHIPPSPNGKTNHPIKWLVKLFKRKPKRM
jgi:hypothetical protein